MPDSPEIASLAAALRRRFFRHNLHALLLASLSLGGALVLWGLAYAATAWLTLLAVTVITGVQGREAAMPASFPRLFGIGVAALLLAAWARRTTTPNDAPGDAKTFDEQLADVVLAIPSLTLAIWGNLSAWRWLSAREIEQAARLLFAVLQEKKLPLTSAPLIVPEDAIREKVIIALLLIGVLEFRHEESNSWLRLARAAERNLLAPEAAALDQGRR